MIDSIGSNSGLMPPPPPPKSSTESLSSDQESTINDILSQYDSSNLSEQDASSLVEAFSEAGIQPSSAFEEVLAEAGFSARDIGDLAGVGGEGPARAPTGNEASNELSSVVDYLDAFYSDNEDANESTSESIYNMLADRFGLSTSDSLIDVTA